MKVHELKTLNPYFQDVWAGLKDFEVIKNDRNFKVGDFIHLIEYDDKGNRLDRSIVKRIKYILQGGKYGISKNYVILGFDSKMVDI